MKNWQFQLVSGIAVLFCLLYFNAVMHYGADKTLLDKTVIVLTFLGTLAGILAAISVIYAFISYKDFKENINEAENNLQNLREEHKNIKGEIVKVLSSVEIKEGKLESILKDYSHKERMFNLLSRYVLNESIKENEIEWISLAINTKDLDMGYRLYSILAKFKQEDDEIRINEAIFGNEKFNEEIIELGIKAIPYYAMLAKLEPNAEQSYRDHIRYIIKHFIESKNLSNEMIERVRQIILDVVREDEFYLFNLGMDNDLIEIIAKINEIFKISYQDLQSYELINPYNYRGKRISNIFKS